MEADPSPAESARRAEIMAWRRQTRAELLALRMALPLDAHREGSTAVLASIVDAFPTILASKVGIYWPFKREINVFPLADRILAGGGAVSLPVVVEKKQPVQFRAWRPGEPLARGAYDIPVPRDGAVVEPEMLVVAFVGFDEANYRLGYGSGYYDRTLAAADPRPFTIGVGFELGRLPTIHPLPHDIPMDVIVTEAGVFRGPGQGA